MYWVFKTEPNECSIDDLEAAGTAGVCWEGVRNYQARNFLRDSVNIGDSVLIHHSSCDAIGIVGVAQIVSSAFSDPSQFLPDSIYFEPKATSSHAPWIAVQVAFVERFPTTMSFKALRSIDGLAQMQLLKKGTRLSIIPTTKLEFDLVLSAARDYIQV